MEREKNFGTNNEQSIIDDMRAKKSYLYSIKGKSAEINEKICDIVEDLERDFPGTAEIPAAEDHYLFHIIKSSTKDRDACVKELDLPNREIAKRFEELYLKYKDQTG